MARRTIPAPAEIEARQWSSSEEIDRAIAKVERRINELQFLNIQEDVLQHTGAATAVVSNIRETIRDVFGPHSPEFDQYQYIDLGPSVIVPMSDYQWIHEMENGRRQVVGILNGLIGRLKEKREELTAAGTSSSKVWLDDPSLHTRINAATTKLFVNGHHWEAVFAASKVLVNYAKERSGQHHLDGAALMRTVFSRNNPILAFNDLSDQTDLDEQEGTMHLFEGVVLAIRNPGGHTFPEETEQRAAEYISLISLLMYRLEEAKFRKP